MGEKPCETRISNVRICPKKVLKVKPKHKTYFFSKLINLFRILLTTLIWKKLTKI